MRVVAGGDDDVVEVLGPLTLGRVEFDGPAAGDFARGGHVVVQPDVELEVLGGGANVAQNLLGRGMEIVRERPIIVGQVVMVADVLQPQVRVGLRPDPADDGAPFEQHRLMAELVKGLGGGNA